MGWTEREPWKQRELDEHEYLSKEEASIRSTYLRWVGSRWRKKKGRGRKNGGNHVFKYHLESLLWKPLHTARAAFTAREYPPFHAFPRRYLV